MKVMTARGATQAVGQTFNLDWAAFVKWLRDHDRPYTNETDAVKSSLWWFSAADYKHNRRRRENIQGRCELVVADLDGVHDTEAVLKHLGRWRYVAWTTWSSTKATPRWRVALPIAAPGIEPSEFSAFVRKILAPIESAAKIDAKSYTPEQLWFVPAHKHSQRKHHHIWENAGPPIQASGEVVHVDFTGVQLITRPEEITKGSRNEALVHRLHQADALRSASRSDLQDIAITWNERLPEPMARREVLDVVRKTWNWMQRGAGLAKRADAWRQVKSELVVEGRGAGLFDESIAGARMPESIVGDFLYPGATMISAKMKEGKSYLTMQLALSVATGEPFLKGPKHEGFLVKAKRKVCILALEDTPAGIQKRFHRNIAAGHLPRATGKDVMLLFAADLARERENVPEKIDGLVLFEALVDKWYKDGYRVIAIDPLRVLEAELRVVDYPGCVPGMNIHARDFQTMRYFTNLAQQYSDLCILVSMHHGKNKSGHAASDPGDMIAGTTGFGAGAVTTISLLPAPKQLEADDEDREGNTSKRRELYLHGRYTREARMLIEQNKDTGVWVTIGRVSDELMSSDREKYFRTLIEMGATEKFFSAEDIAKAIGTPRADTVHKMLKRCVLRGSTYNGWRILVKRGPGGGYRLVTTVRAGPN